MKNIKILLTKRFVFSSSHRMLNNSFSKKENNKYFGKCQNIHGHNYELEVTVSGDIEEKTQCVINLNLLKKIVDIKLIKIIDHQYLNEVPLIKKNTKGLPVTLENLSLWIWKFLETELKKRKIDLYSIRLQESENNSLVILKNEKGK